MKKSILLFITLIVFSCLDKTEKLETKESIKHDTIANKISELNKIKDSIQNKEKDFLELGFELIKNERVGDLKLELTEKQVLEILGKPTEKSETEFWDGDVLYHQSFIFKNKGIELDMAGVDENIKLINAITINNSCNLKTTKNIGIGSTYEEVKNAYYNYYNKEESNLEILTAGTIYGGIIFNFKNNRVTDFFIGAAAE